MKKILLPVVVILLFLLHAMFLIPGIPFIPELFLLASAFLVALLGLILGKRAGLLLGIFIGLSGFCLLYLHADEMEGFLFLAVLGGVFSILSGLVFGIWGDALRQKEKKAAKLLKEKEEDWEVKSRQLADLKSVAERLTCQPAYRKGEPVPPFFRPDLERIFGILADRSLSGSDAGEGKGGHALNDTCFRLLAEVFPEAMAVMDLEGTIHACHSPLMAFLGYRSRTEVMDKSILDFVPDNQREVLEANIKSVLIPGLNKTETYQVKPKPGWNLRHFPALSFRLSLTGNPQSLLAVLMTRKSEGPFPKKEEWYRKHVWVLTSEGYPLYFSPGLASLLEYESVDLKQYPISIFLDDGDAEVFRRAAASGDDLNTKHCLSLSAKSGKRLEVFMEIFPVFGDSGKHRGAVVFVEDVTDRKLMEKSLQHHQAMERLIADVSSRFFRCEPGRVKEEISRSMEIIGDFLGFPEGSVQIFSSLKTGEALASQWVKKDKALRDPFKEDILTIPILDGNEPVGCFRLVLEKSSRAWMEEDTTLLKMMGEIFHHALVRHHTLGSIRIAEEKMRITLHSIKDAVLVTDAKGSVALLNEEAERLTGWVREDAIGKPFHDVLLIVKGNLDGDIPRQGIPSPEGHSMAAYDRKVLVLRSKYGTERFISALVSHIRDDAGNHFGDIYIFRDITEKKKREEEIIYLSFHDKLTGLHNRVFFEAELQRLDTKRQLPVTILMGDCNGLKLTNDLFGHQEGNNLLVRLAGILRKVTRKEDIVARWGGDEYAVILPKTTPETAEEIRRRILLECELASDSPVRLSISLGAATKSEESQKMADILTQAEEAMYKQKLLEDPSNRSLIISSMVKTIIRRSMETDGHGDRIQSLVSRIALEIGLSDIDLADLRLLAMLHDLGKVCVPDAILQKPGKLTPEEWEEVKGHAQKGFGMARASHDLEGIARYILHHHEHWDGSGYPVGLKGSDIPLLSRIVSIVDAYDVMTHASAYKKALTHEQAMEEIHRFSGSQFDPVLVEVFVKIMGGYRKEAL